MKILVSACLLGADCKYNQKNNDCQRVRELIKEHEIVPVCPEIMGGLPTPRIPAEICGDRVITKEGRDVTAQYQKGASETLKLAKLYGCNLAVLKERSPSCGCGMVYDGTFSKTLTEGDGITAAVLKKNGIQVAGENYEELESMIIPSMNVEKD